MGLEARCEARIQGRRQEGVARLEEKDLVFRGASHSSLELMIRRGRRPALAAARRGQEE